MRAVDTSPRAIALLLPGALLLVVGIRNPDRGWTILALAGATLLIANAVVAIALWLRRRRRTNR